jgi:hypothetical protein
MKQKNYLTLDSEFIKYCELNKIDNIDKFAKEVFKKGFDLVKYGETPKIGKPEPPPTKMLWEGEDPNQKVKEPKIEVILPPTPKFIKDIYDE